MERDEKEFQDVCGLNLTMIKYFFPSSTLSCTSLIRFIWCGFSKSTLFIICNTHNTIRSSIFWDNSKIRTEELKEKSGLPTVIFTWKLFTGKKFKNRRQAWIVKNMYDVLNVKSSWRNRLARSTVNREAVGSIPTEDDHFIPLDDAERHIISTTHGAKVFHFIWPSIVKKCRRKLQSYQFN